MRVELFSFLQQAAETPALDVEARDVRDLLRAVARASGPELTSRLFTPEGRLRPEIQVLVNGRNIRYLQGEDTPLKSGDRVALIPPAAGG